MRLKPANITPPAVITGAHGKIRLLGNYDTGALSVDGSLLGMSPAQWADLKATGDAVFDGMSAVQDGQLTRDPNPGVVPDSVVGTPFPGRPGYVVGTCGHAVAGSEWDHGYCKCEGC
jgi:hypothetical protein